MTSVFQALSIVEPSGSLIAQGVKTLEIRSWKPEYLPLKNLVIVENKNYLNHDDDQERGLAVAIIDIESIHAWQEGEVELACASTWSEGYFAWVITNIRRIEPPIKTLAKRKLYLIDIEHT